MIETAVGHEVFAFPHFPDKSVASDKPEQIERRTAFSDLIRTVFVKRSETHGSVVMFSSPNRYAGVSYIASCVAVELAQTPEPILLADAQAIVELARTSHEHLSDVGERIGTGNVWVLGMDQVHSLGTLVPARASMRTADVIDALRAEFTHVVIDGPAMNDGKSALALASSIDGVVFVAKVGCTGQDDLVGCYRKVTEAGGRALGSVLNCQ